MAKQFSNHQLGKPLSAAAAASLYSTWTEKSVVSPYERA
jgi:hypothetical protein